ncbi:MAG: DUF3857 domain-containing protein [Phycisphaerales bacterium]|nr:MAG: DUF3857 domain-containing protein [Phycisphaerales bacterium]
MKHNVIKTYASWLGTVGVAGLTLAAVVGCTTAAALAQPRNTGEVDLGVGATQFPDDDAIILRWEQHWTLDKDGTVHRRDHKWIKLLNKRPIRQYGDPRIDFAKGEDKLIIHKAQSILPDGTILPVPDYSLNFAGPDDVAGWPEYSAWQQQIVSFGGIEDGVVLELDYEVITSPGITPWVWADIRVDDEYPVVERIISVTIPQSAKLTYQIDRVADSHVNAKSSTQGGSETRTWTFSDLAGVRRERQSYPWRQRCGRLRFTTCPSLKEWVTTIVNCINKATVPDEKITKFAEEFVKEEIDPAQRARKIAKKLHDSFNIVDSWKTTRSLKCRAAGDVFHVNYGSPLEAAGLWAAAMRAAGLQASVSVGVDATAWDELVPTGSSLAGAVVSVDLPDAEPMHIHPQHGVFKSPGHWGRHLLLGLTESGIPKKTYIYARGEEEPSELNISGRIVVGDDGSATGELRTRLTGAFYDPDNLDSAGAQKSLVTGMAGRILAGFNVASHSVLTLSDETFRATANVASDGALQSYEKQHLLKLGDGPAFLADTPLPLGQSYRSTDVHLGSRLREQVDLTIEIPEKWSVSIAPASLAAVTGSWGSVSQKVEVDKNIIRLHRAIKINAERIHPNDFKQLREAINALRVEQSLLLVCTG